MVAPDLYCRARFLRGHRSVVLDHDYHVTIQVYPDWVLDDQGNHAWNHSAEGMSSTERTAHSWREYRDSQNL